MSGKGKKNRKKSVASGSKRKSATATEDDRLGKRQRSASASPDTKDTASRRGVPEPSTPTAQSITYTIARSPLKPDQKESPPPSPPIPATPAPAAAAAAAAAAPADDPLSLEADEEYLPQSLPPIKPKTAAILGVIRVRIGEGGKISNAVCEGQIIRHVTKARDTSLTRRAAAAAAVAVVQSGGLDSVLASDDDGPTVSELAANNIYVPLTLLSNIDSNNAVFKVARLSDHALFAMKLIADHKSDGQEDSDSHHGTYFAERGAVLRAMRDCDWTYVVPQYSISSPSADTPCTTVRMKLMETPTLSHAMHQRRFASHEVLMTLTDMLAAVACVHKLGIIHGAVYATNFLRDDVTGRFKITDFESAVIGMNTGAPGTCYLVARSSRDVSHDFKHCKVCAAHDVPLAYRSPDNYAQARSTGSVTSAEDLWCIGVLLYVMVTNALPFPGATHAEVQHALDAHFKDETRVFRTFRSAAQQSGFDADQVDDMCQLLEHLFQRLPTGRIDAEGALQSLLFTRRTRAAAAAAAAAVTAADEMAARCAGAGLSVPSVGGAIPVVVPDTPPPASISPSTSPLTVVSSAADGGAAYTSDGFVPMTPLTPLHAPAIPPASPPAAMLEDSLYSALGFQPELSARGVEFVSPSVE